MRHWIRFQSWFSFPWLRFIYHYVCCLYFGCIYHCISCTRKRQAKQSPQRLQLPSHWFSQDSVIRLLLHLIDLLSAIQGSKSSYFWDLSRPLKGLFSGSCKSIWAIWQSRPQTISNSCLFRNQYYFLLFVGCKNTESPIRSIYILAPTICSLIGKVTITSINGDFIREVMVTSINATICSLILVTLILVNFF